MTYARIGDVQSAESRFRLALEIAESPGSVAGSDSNRHARAAIHSGLGQLLRTIGKTDVADREYSSSLALWQELCTGTEAKEIYRKGLAQTLNSLGVLCGMQQRNNDAADNFAAARTEYQKLADDHPSNPAYRKEVASSLGNLGVILMDQGKKTEALSALKESNEATRILASQFPDVPDYQAVAASDKAISWVESNRRAGFVLMKYGIDPTIPRPKDSSPTGAVEPAHRASKSC